MTPGNALYLGLLVLLPLIPAYVLYRFLPSSADVEGPFQKLKVKLGGAFAGYIILFFAITQVSSRLPAYDVWTVVGHLTSEDGAAEFDESTVRFTIKPPDTQVDPDGAFRLRIFRVPDPAGESVLPTVIVEHEHPRYSPIRLDLEERGTLSGRRRQVRLSDTLRLMLKPQPEVATHVDP